MSILIEQTENELRAEINFWNKFVAGWQEIKSEPVHPRAFEALDRAESRLEHILTGQNRQAESRVYASLLH